MSAIKRTIAAAGQRGGLLSLWRSTATLADAKGLLRLKPRGALVYMFHRISEASLPFRLGTPVSLFEAFCGHLAENYQVLPLVEWEERRQRKALGARSVALTFDDGFADSYELALPILKRYGLPATIFVATAFVDGKTVPWACRLAHIIQHGRPPGTPLGVDGVAINLNDRAARLKSLLSLAARLTDMERDRREAVLLSVADKLGVDDVWRVGKEMLNWDQLRRMQAQGFVCGAHTSNHCQLSQLSSADIRREIAEGREELEYQLKEKVETFAYPYGKRHHLDERAAAISRDLGFKAACTAVFGANTYETDSMLLKRVSLNGSTLPIAALNLERYFYLH